MHDTNTNLEKVIETSLTSASFSCVYNIGTGWNLTPMRLNATNVSPSNPGLNFGYAGEAVYDISNSTGSSLLIHSACTMMTQPYVLARVISLNKTYAFASNNMTC